MYNYTRIVILRKTGVLVSLERNSQFPEWHTLKYVVQVNVIFR